jgi:hypothetical protein
VKILSRSPWIKQRNTPWSSTRPFNKFEKYMLRVEKITGKHLKCTDQVLMIPLQSLSIFTID